MIPKSSLSISESTFARSASPCLVRFITTSGSVWESLRRCPPPTQVGRVIRDVPSFMDPSPLACDSYLIYGQRMLAMEGTIDSECEYADPCKGHGRLIISDEGVRWERPRLLANRANQAPGWHAMQMGS